MQRTHTLAAIGAITLCLTGCASDPWDANTPPQCRVREGRATVSCLASDAGALSECRVISEEPAGCGFGREALVASSRATLNPNTRFEVGEGGRVTFPVTFRLAR